MNVKNFKYEVFVSITVNSVFLVSLDRAEKSKCQCKGIHVFKHLTCVDAGCCQWVSEKLGSANSFNAFH